MVKYLGSIFSVSDVTTGDEYLSGFLIIRVMILESLFGGNGHGRCP